MIRTIYIPVGIDNVDDLKFSYDGKNIDDEEYGNLMLKNVERTNNLIEQQKDIQYIPTESTNKIYDSVDNTDGFALRECEAFITDADGKEVTDGFLLKKFEDGKKLILVVDINPNSIDEDSQSELKYWITDSDKVLKNMSIKDDAKIRILPKTHFGIKIGDNIYNLNECRLIEMYILKNHPFKFAILVEKITENLKA